MLTVELWHSRDGYRLHVIEAPAWALALGSLADAGCAYTGHRLCGGRWPIGRRLGAWLLHPAGRRRRDRWSVPLSDNEARATFPESVIPYED